MLTVLHQTASSLRNTQAWLSIASPLARYVFAVVATTAAMGLRTALTALFGPGFPEYITLYPAVMAVALVAGFGPGAMATLVGGGTAVFWLLEPEASWGIASPIDRVALAIFLATGVFMSAIAGVYRRNRAKAEAYDRQAKLRASREALRASEDRFRSIFEHAGNGIAITDLRGRFVQCNPAYCAMLGYTEDELRLIDFASLIHPDDREHNLAETRRLLEQRKPDFEIENRYLHKDGRVVWVRKFVSVLRDASGTPQNFFALITDVTARKRDEEALRAEVAVRKEAEARMQASLEEKEVLLREVHHRVKNNLQIVSSLLNLQSRQLTDPAMLEVFSNTRDRVRAMAAVHERLYESGNFAQIDLADHLGSLTRMLMRAHAAAGAASQLVLRLDPVTVDLNAAVPLSLIANELITNALKYAFAGGRHGTLTIGLRGTDGDHELSIADDGPGFPTGIDPAGTRTLGLRLVRDLARQIRGELTIDSGASGTMIVVRWPAHPPLSEPASPLGNTRDESQPT